MKQDVCLLRTGRLMDADLVCSLLDERGVPFYRGMETSGGLKTVMGVAPRAGPGTWFTVLVPVEEEAPICEPLENAGGRAQRSSI